MKIGFLYEQILQNTSGGIMYIEDRKIVFINPSAARMLGKSKDELLDHNFAETFFEFEENDDFNQMVLDAIYDPQTAHENVVQFFDGRDKKILYMKTSLLRDEDRVGIVILLDDITELMTLRGMTLDLKKLNQDLKTARDQYKRESEIDKLTGLFNKATMENLCRKFFEETDQIDQISALFVIDLDHFKEANDTYGHQFGDQVLKKFSDCLKKIFKPTDSIGRFGGDEFVVLMREIPREEIVRQTAAEILKSAREISIDGKALNLSASVGITIVKNQKDYSKIFKAADDSVYLVKSQGRDGFSIDSCDKIS